MMCGELMGYRLEFQGGHFKGEGELKGPIKGDGVLTPVSLKVTSWHGGSSLWAGCGVHDFWFLLHLSF